MLEHVETQLKPTPYSQADLKAFFEEDNLQQVVVDIPYSNEVLELNPNFELYKRAKHVFSEAKRVWDFKDVCDNETLSNEEKAKQLGALMNGSQDSCRDLFECSSPELDELTALCRELGAFGSRLTGAGWGGCSVSLVKESELSVFVDQVQQKYYQK